MTETKQDVFYDLADAYADSVANDWPYGHDTPRRYIDRYILAIDTPRPGCGRCIHADHSLTAVEYNDFYGVRTARYCQWCGRKL